MGRWTDQEIIRCHWIGKERRYLKAEVEEDLRRFRFGPPLPASLGTELRERIRVDELLKWFGPGKRDALKRRMLEGGIPFYKIGQTYLFSADEIAASLGVSLVPAPNDPVPLPSATGGDS